MTDADHPSAEVIRLVTGGKEGKLRAPSGEPMPVRVYDRNPDVLTLVLMLADDGEQLQSEPVEPVVLEYASARGLVRFQGRAVLEQRDLVSFAVATDPEVVQRRDFVRVEASQPVVVETRENGEPVRCHALDISGGGMLLRGPEALEPDSIVRFSLKLDDGAAVEGTARVVRASGDGRRALVFEEISPADRQRLIHFVFACQRAALAKGRSR